MAERPRFFDDLAGVAGGALSVLTGVRDEAEAMVRARVEEAIRAFDLVRRSELDAVAELAANARAGQERADERLAALEAQMAELIVRQSVASASSAAGASSAASAPQAVDCPPAGGGGPGMIA